MVIAGRTAVVQDVYDWKTKRGQEVLANRQKNGKWSSLVSEDFKYILLLLFPELPMDGKQGIGIPEVVPYYHPTFELPTPLFGHYPQHLHDLVTGKRKI